MGLGGPSLPSAPNAGSIGETAAQLAQQQQLSNIGAQAGSNYQQVNPYGSLSYSVVGTGPNGVPIYQATNSFSPSQQNLYNQYTAGQQMEGSIANQMLANMNYPMNMPAQAIGDVTSGYLGEALGAYASALQPFYNLQTEQAQSNLENQGFSPGSSGYYAGMLPIATGQASGLAAAASNFAPQAFNMANQVYSLPYNWAAQSLPMGAPTTGTSNYTGGAALQPTNNIGAFGTVGNVESSIYQTQVQAALAQYQAQQQLLSGLIGAGGNLFGGLIGGGI